METETCTVPGCEEESVGHCDVCDEPRCREHAGVADPDLFVCRPDDFKRRTTYCKDSRPW